MEIIKIAKGYSTDLGKAELGGKAMSLITMTEMGLNVPPAFVIPCKVSLDYLKSDDRDAFMDKVMDKVHEADAWLTKTMLHTPLVAVRSGAPISMPGMMDTILNVGLTQEVTNEWVGRIGVRAVADSKRRLIQMMATTAFDMDGAGFEEILKAARTVAKVETDAELSAPAMASVATQFEGLFINKLGSFPASRAMQLRAAIEAVFRSWNSERAVVYRKLNNIPDDMGTAVTVQAMVFGNAGDTSGTGVYFTRNPATGEDKLYGDFLENAQGEDVVAGIRTPIKLDKLPAKWAWLEGELEMVADKLELFYDDMVDIEFTVMSGKLFILQSRVGKRSAIAACRIAWEMIKDGSLDAKQAFTRVSKEQFKLARRPMIDPAHKAKPMLKGIEASPGVAVGRPVLSSKEAVKAAAKGEKVILVTHETTPDDIAGMSAAVGILTQTGGMTSHAAVVARDMNKPCVVGCTDMDLSLVAAMKTLTLCGTSGRVWGNDKVPVIDASQEVFINGLMDLALTKLGYADAMAFPHSGTRPQVVYAAAFWGQDKAADMVFKALADMGDLSDVILDCSAPDSFSDGDDVDLSFAFGTGAFVKEKEWGCSYLADKLFAFGPHLKGLTVTNFSGMGIDEGMLTKAGYVTVKTVETVADLMTGQPVKVSGAFISKVMGGHDAYQTFLGMLNATGMMFPALPQAVPAEYATFKVLGG